MVNENDWMCSICCWWILSITKLFNRIGYMYIFFEKKKSLKTFYFYFFFFKKRLLQLQCLWFETVDIFVWLSSNRLFLSLQRKWFGCSFVSCQPTPLNTFIMQTFNFFKGAWTLTSWVVLCRVILLHCNTWHTCKFGSTT